MKRESILAIAIFLVTLTVFLPVSHNGFVDFDDPDYITQNPHVATGLSMANVFWALSHVHAHNWHPFTWISHMVDVELFGLKASGHHLMSAFIHSASAVILFLLLIRLTGIYGPAAFCALLFALHPLRVESVAWAAERKDVLATFFFLLSLSAYVSYVQKRKAAAYFWALAFHTLGLTAKQMGVTLPFVLLLLDYWPLKRISTQAAWKQILREKVPFLVLSLVAGLTVYLVQKGTGVVHGGEIFPLPVRLSNALYSCVAYLGKMIWPVNLAIFYPHPLNSLPPIYVLLSALFLLALTWVTLFIKRPYLTVGWLWYLITLSPVLGLIQVGIQGMADRYTYLPSIGILMAISYGAKELTEKWPKLKKWLICSGGVVVVIFSLLTVRQLGVWQNSITLYTHAVKVTKDNYWALNNLGAALFAEGKREEAKGMFLSALSILPEYPGANKNLAALLYQEGKYGDALSHIERALRVQPTNPEYLTAKGAILLKLGDRAGAIESFRRALRASPGYGDAVEGLKEARERP